MPRKPVWSEGVLVSQHHFQQADRYHEESLRFRVEALASHAWGITKLVIDLPALNSNHFRIAQFEAIWPDGTISAWGKERPHSTPAGRDFSDALTASPSGLDVFLALPTPSESGAELARPHESRGDRRYVEAEASVMDKNSGKSAASVSWAQPNVRILFGNESRHGTQTVRVAQLIRESSGRVIVRDSCVPAVLHLATSPFLESGLNRLRAAISSKQSELRGEQRQRKAGSMDLTVTSTLAFDFLHTLSGAAPRLAHFSHTGLAHPEALYLELCGLLGQLSSFSADETSAQAPLFDYLDLGATFEPLYARILSLLSTKLETPYVEIELSRRAEDGMYLGKIRDVALLRKELFVAVRSSQEESVVRDRVPAIMKIASWKQIYTVVKQARRGVPLQVEWNPSSSLPLRPGLIFFRLQREGEFWEDVRNSSSISLSLPDEKDWRSATLSLYAIDAKYLT